MPDTLTAIHAARPTIAVDGEDHSGTMPGRKVLLRGDGARSTVTANTVSGNVTLLRGPASPGAVAVTGQA